ADCDASYEMIVVDDQSTDATASLARECGAVVVAVALRHIAAVRNAGAREARGALFVFLDADTRISSEVIAAMRRARAVGCVAGGAVVRFERQVPLNARLGLGCWNLASRLLRWAAGCFIFTT